MRRQRQPAVADVPQQYLKLVGEQTLIPQTVQRANEIPGIASPVIPANHAHRCLSNPGKIPLELIEVQSGSYLGEDDIVRFEDSYGRASK